jgi:hypothetical protein
MLPFPGTEPNRRSGESINGLSTTAFSLLFHLSLFVYKGVNIGRASRFSMP